MFSALLLGKFNQIPRAAGTRQGMAAPRVLSWRTLPCMCVVWWWAGSCKVGCLCWSSSLPGWGQRLPAFPAASPGCSEVLRASLEGSSAYVLKLHGNICHRVFEPITLPLFFPSPLYFSLLSPPQNSQVSILSGLVASFFFSDLVMKLNFFEGERRA